MCFFSTLGQVDMISSLGPVCFFCLLSFILERNRDFRLQSSVSQCANEAYQTKKISCSTQQEDARGWPTILSLRLVSSAGAWYRDEFGKIYLLSNLSELSVSICSYFVSNIDDFLTFEMWEGIFCTFYADSFVHVENFDFIPWEIWHPKDN